MFKSRFSRRFALALLPLAALAAIAVAGELEVIHFNADPSVAPGQSFSAGVSVNQAPMSVTFTSSPAGLVNYTATVNSTSATVSVPTSSSAGQGTYTITARPSAGGAGKTKAVIAAPGI